MDNALRVRGIQRVSHLNANIQQPLQLERAALYHVLQGLSAEALHHEKEMPLVLANFVDGTNIRMIQRRRRPRLAAKTLERLRIFRGFVRQKLQRDETAEHR